jgi:hypothetical protein
MNNDNLKAMYLIWLLQGYCVYNLNFAEILLHYWFNTLCISSQNWYCLFLVFTLNSMLVAGDCLAALPTHEHQRRQSKFSSFKTGNSPADLKRQQVIPQTLILNFNIEVGGTSIRCRLVS